MDGTVVTISDDSIIQQFILKKNLDHHSYDRYYKTVNIYKFSKDYLTGNYLPFLEAYVRAMGHNEYYEQVLSVIASLDKQELVAMPLSGQKWYEIDDLQDFEIAQTIFAPSEREYDGYLNRHGGYWRFPDILDFCYLVNPYFPPDEMADEMRRSFNSLMRAYPSSATVQSHLAAKLFGVEPSHILVGNGAAELIGVLGEEVEAARIGVFVPTFEEYLKRFPRAVVAEVPIRDNELKPDVSHLKRAAEETDALVVVNPDNPSGQCLSTAEVLELASHMEHEGKRLILDESFVDFADPNHCVSLLRQDVLDEHPHLVIIKSLSKSYGIPGLRLGVLATGDSELRVQLRAKVPVWNINSFAEYFLQIVGKYQSSYNIGNQRIRDERSRLHGLLASIPGVHVIPSQANYLLCEIGHSVKSRELAERLLANDAILVKDCSTKAGVVDRQFVRVAVRDAADDNLLFSACDRVMRDLIDGGGK